MSVMNDQELEEFRKKTIIEMEKVRNDPALTEKEKYIRKIELARKLGKAFFIKWG